MQLDLYHRHAAALQASPDLRKRFYGFVRSSWDNISSLHAGLVQVALAQLASKAGEAEIEAMVNAISGPEFEDFPNKALAGAFDGRNALTASGVLGRQLAETKAQRDQLKAERESLDRLSRYRHRMLRSKWLRLGLITHMCHALVSNRGKTPHEKMLWLRDACMASWWLKLGEKLGSKSAYHLRRGTV
jgi:hypothetical protein